MAQYVEVVAYRPEWRAVYEKERERIAAILGRNLLEIHIFERGNRRDIIRHLAVRDYLWAHSGRTGGLWCAGAARAGLVSCMPGRIAPERNTGGRTIGPAARVSAEGMITGSGHL